MLGGEGGAVLYLLSLPPYKPRSEAVSQQARNKRGAYFSFSIWGNARIRAWRRNDPATEKKKRQKLLRVGAQIAFRRKRRGGDSGNRESFMHTGRQNIPDRDRDFGTGR